MCGGKGLGGAVGWVVPNFQKLGADKLFPKPKPPTLKKPPVPVEPDISLAQAHAKEAAIGAYSYSDTVLTGGKGLGSTSGKSLWKSLGAS